MQPIILASSSIYRHALLERLQLPFSVVSPDVDETALSGETPEQTALRLAQLKARKVAENGNGVIVGSVAGGRIVDAVESVKKQVVTILRIWAQ